MPKPERLLRNLFVAAFSAILLFLSAAAFPTATSAKEYSQTTSDTTSSHKVEFFVQTLGTALEGSLDKVTVKVSDIVGPLYPLNFQAKEWSSSNYKAYTFVQKFEPCSYETTPQCNGSACTASEWSAGTDYTVVLDFSCRSHDFDITHYYALGLHSGNSSNKFRVLGSSSDSYSDGELKTGVTKYTADCYYGGNDSWGGWSYNQISTQVSVCHADGNVSDIFFELTPPVPATPPDTTPPAVFHTLSPASADGNNGWYVTQPEITLSSSDSDLNKTYYSWDNSSWTEYTGVFSGTEEGDRVLYYKADDTTGNVSDVSNVSFKVDTVSPENPGDFEALYDADSGYIELTWDVDEEDVDEVTIYRSFDEDFGNDSEKLVGTNPGTDDTETYKTVKSGKKYYFKIYAVDEAGNTSGNEKTSLRVPEAEVGVGDTEKQELITTTAEKAAPDTVEPTKKTFTRPKKTGNTVREMPQEVLGASSEKTYSWIYWLGGLLFLIMTTLFFFEMKKKAEE
jgi:hypothetical protein